MQTARRSISLNLGIKRTGEHRQGKDDGRLALLRESSHALVATEDIGTIADIMLDLAMSYTDAERGSLMLADMSGDLYVFAAKGFALRAPGPDPAGNGGTISSH